MVNIYNMLQDLDYSNDVGMQHAWYEMKNAAKEWLTDENITVF